MRVSQRTLDYLKWDRLAAELVRLTSTSMGAHRAEALTFLSTKDAIVAELSRVEQLKAVMDSGAAPDFAGIADLEGLLERAGKEGTLAPEELLEVSTCIGGLTRLANYFAAHGEQLPGLEYLSRRLHDLGFLSHRITVSVDREGRVRDDASPVLREMRERAYTLQETIKEKLEDFLKGDRAAEALQERYYTLREDRYVVPVKAERRSVVEGIVHAVSQSGATVFLEPKFLISLNNRLKMAREEVKREEYLVLAGLSRDVADNSGELKESLEAAGEFDFVAARALMSTRFGGGAPEMGELPVLRLKKARSPILLLQGQDVVSSDIIIGDPARVLVLSGPNAGGKSVALSSCGLSILMAHAGLHPPLSPDSYLPVLEGVHAVPGDMEDVEQQLSTFAGHLTELNKVVARVSEKHLVLVDEIAVGTEPLQGSAIGAGYLQEFAARGCLAMVATHYERLKALAMADDVFENASMGVDWETLAPTYRLVHGKPGSSRTFEMAERYSVPEEVVRSAREFLDGAAGNVLEEAIARLSEREQELSKAVARQEEAAEEAAQLKRRRTLALDQLQRQAGRIISRKVEEAAREVDEALEGVSTLVSELQQGPAAHGKVESTRRVLVGVRDKLRKRRAKVEEEEAVREVLPLKTGAVEPGGEVLVKKFNKKAVVVSVSEKDRTAQLKMGPMRMRLPLDELVPIRREKPTAAAGQKKWDRPGPMPGAVTRLDLRGKSSDEALAELEKTLDEAMLGVHATFLVVHGHGTGKLRTAVRAYLNETSYPVEFRKGKREEGGDGVTVVTMV